MGGQGAPFAPIYHKALFGEQDFPMAVVNIGGIANITCLGQDGRVSGYDIGPGNCLMDVWFRSIWIPPMIKKGPGQLRVGLFPLY